VAEWFFGCAREHGKFTVELIDLKEVNLPLLDEPHHPRLQKYEYEHTRRWSDRIQRTDAFVFVTPEYNYTLPPALVNALDTVYHEWTYKPVAFVSYGGVSGGMRAVQTGKLMVTGFKMMPMVEAVNVPFFSQLMENGVFKPTTVGTPQGGVASPLLANIVLNHLDWQLHKLGYRFVRYADDFVVLCQSKAQAEEAKNQVTHILNQLGLQLSTEKTRITTYGQGYSFLGFVMSSRSKGMRPKSQDKFKDKVQELTRRSHNLDAQLIEKLNRVIRGTANYFAPRWSTNRWFFGKLDSWIRRRLRCMKYKRFSYHHNRRMRAKQFVRLGLMSMESFCKP